MLRNLIIKINNTPIMETVLDDLMELTVDTDLFLPAMFSFTLLDSFDASGIKLRYCDDATTFRLGAPVEISFPPENETGMQIILISGEITTLEPVFTAGQTLLRVRGYDPSHRMTRAQKTRAFGDGTAPMMLKDIISKIASENGMTPSVDPSLASISYPYLLQYNQTDWQFLEQHARMLGCQMYVQNRVFYFVNTNKPRSLSPVLLDWGKDLSRFEPRVTLMGQVSQNQVLEWNPDTGQALQISLPVSSVSLRPQIQAVVTNGGNAGAALQKTFGAALSAEVTEGGVSTTQMQRMADANLAERENNFVRGEGFCNRGNPSIQAGSLVQINSIGTMFSGTYFVTKAVHQWRSGEYTVAFSVAGSQSNSVYGLLRPKAEQADGRIYGMLPAVVTSNQDPQQMGRVKVSFPWMPLNNGAQCSSGWVRVASPGGGNDAGLCFIPEVNEEVLVAFEQGNPNAGYVVGRLWSKKFKPPITPAAFKGGKVLHRLIRSSTGLTLLFDDSQGAEKVVLQDKAGTTSITLDATKGILTLKSKGDFVIEAGGKVKIKSKLDFAAETDTSIALTAKMEAVLKNQANQLGLKPAGVELSGVKLDLKANTQAALSGAAMLELKGGIVKIN